MENISTLTEKPFTTRSNGHVVAIWILAPLELKRTHVVMVHDGSSDVIYFNGNKVNAKAVSGMLDDTQHPLGIGWDPIDKGGFFDGSFDNVVLINKAMTETEVNAWYQVEVVFPGTQSDLVAGYSMNGNGDDDTNGACCSDMDSGTPLALNTWTRNGHGSR
jgi:hypothetical protein